VIKSALDVAVAWVALLGLAPAVAASALALHFSLGRPVLFRQRRPGSMGRPVTLYTLHTMRGADGPDGDRLPDHRRLTRLGRFLRSTSMDEVPRLWNVLKAA
jgi:sugar transferase EpsL